MLRRFFKIWEESRCRGQPKLAKKNKFTSLRKICYARNIKLKVYYFLPIFLVDPSRNLQPSILSLVIPCRSPHADDLYLLGSPPLTWSNKLSVFKVRFSWFFDGFLNTHCRLGLKIGFSWLLNINSVFGAFKPLSKGLLLILLVTFG